MQKAVYLYLFNHLCIYFFFSCYKVQPWLFFFNTKSNAADQAGGAAEIHKMTVLIRIGPAQ